MAKMQRNKPKSFWGKVVWSKKNNFPYSDNLPDLWQTDCYPVSRVGEEGRYCNMMCHICIFLQFIRTDEPCNPHVILIKAPLNGVSILTRYIQSFGEYWADARSTVLLNTVCNLIITGSDSNLFHFVFEVITVFDFYCNAILPLCHNLYKKHLPP